jgi:hypothetical protein
MDTIEQFYIYRKTIKENQLNDKYIVFPTKIFESILKWEDNLNSSSSQYPHP